MAEPPASEPPANETPASERGGGGPATASALSSVVVRIVCGADLVDLASDALWQAGTTAVSEEAAGISRGISVDGHDRVAATVAAADVEDDAGTELIELTGEVPAAAVDGLQQWCREVSGVAELRLVDSDPAWADAWCEHAVAHRVGPLVVRPVWVDEPVGAGEIDLPLDPGPTFGSGSHPSTRGVLAAIVEGITGGERVLDVGSGSGVLSVAALVLGAAKAVAVDIDPAAERAGCSSAELSGVQDRFEFSAGGLAEVEGSFDLVFANMLIGAIEELGVGIRAGCRTGGTMILGGFLESQSDRALAAVQPAEVVSETVEDGWVTLVATAAG